MKIGIIGIGLIGASLAHDFKAAQTGEIHIFDKNPDHVRIARELGIGTHWHDDAAALAQISDLIFLCVPVRSIAAVAAGIAPHLKPGTIVTDVGSVKKPVVDAVRTVLPTHVHYVPGHPAAGLEYYGPAAGKPGLFAGKSYVLTTDDQTDDAATGVVRVLIAGTTGARVLELDPVTHDRVFAYTSHMPHVLAFAAMNATPKAGQEAGENVLPFAGSTYRDWTRVANSDFTMWRDIFLTNGAAIAASLQLYQDEIARLMDMIAAKDEAGITAYIQSSCALRLDMDQKYGAPGPSLPTPVPGKK